MKECLSRWTIDMPPYDRRQPPLTDPEDGDDVTRRIPNEAGLEEGLLAVRAHVPSDYGSLADGLSVRCDADTGQASGNYVLQQTASALDERTGLASNCRNLLVEMFDTCACGTGVFLHDGLEYYGRLAKRLGEILRA